MFLMMSSTVKGVNLVPPNPPREVFSYYCSWYAQNYATCDSGHAGGDIYVFGPNKTNTEEIDKRAPIFAEEHPPLSEGVSVVLDKSLVVEDCVEGDEKQHWVLNADGSLNQGSGGGFAGVYNCEIAPPKSEQAGHGRPLIVYPGADPTCGGRNQRFSINPNGTITTVLDGACFDIYQNG